MGKYLFPKIFLICSKKKDWKCKKVAIGDKTWQHRTCLDNKARHPYWVDALVVKYPQVSFFQPWRVWFKSVLKKMSRSAFPTTWIGRCWKNGRKRWSFSGGSRDMLLGLYGNLEAGRSCRRPRLPARPTAVLCRSQLKCGQGRSVP